MRKLIRNILLIILLLSFLVIPAYSEPSKVEHPIIVVNAGPISEAVFFIRLFELAEIEVDVVYDSNARSFPSIFKKFPVGEIESGKYKTAIFIFGTVDYDYYELDSHYLKFIKIEDVIEDLKFKVNYCKQNGVRIVGIQFYNNIVNVIKVNTIRVIEEIVPYMDSLMVLHNSNLLPELGDKFIEVGKANEIPIEYFAASGVSSNFSSIVIPELKMKFGE